MPVVKPVGPFAKAGKRSESFRQPRAWPTHRGWSDPPSMLVVDVQSQQAVGKGAAVLARVNHHVFHFNQLGHCLA